MPEKMKKDFQRIEAELNGLKKIGQIFSASLSFDELLNQIVLEICHLLDADRGTLFIVDKENKKIWSKIALKSEISKIELPLGKGIAGYVAQSGESINIPDAYKDARFNPEVDKQTGYKTQSILCVPLKRTNPDENQSTEIVGVIQLLNKKNKGVFTAEDLDFLESLGGSIAIYLQNATLLYQLQEKYTELELLYSTENLIASTYNLDTLIEALMEHFLNGLNLKAGGVIFHEKGHYHAFWKILYMNKQPLISQNLLVLPKSMPYQVNQSQWVNLKQLKDQYPDLIQYYQSLQIPAEKVLYIPLLLDQELIGSLQLVQLANEPNIRITETVWKTIGSQITRAYQLYRMRQESIQNERMTSLGNMMSMIVHDLRGPLNNIVGFVDLMSDEDTTSQERIEYKEIVNREVKLMVKMTAEILDFSKGKTSILPTKVGVNEVFELFKQKIAMEMERNNIKFSYSKIPRGRLWADKERLVRAFINLAKNSIEAMEMKTDNKLFDVVVLENDGEFFFHFRDNGPGIPEEIQDTVFEDFVTSGKAGGTGLGLAIVKKIIDEHHGNISFFSESGKGTEFVIQIPGFEKARMV